LKIYYVEGYEEFLFHKYKCFMDKKADRFSNRLIHEHSSNLQLHAHNPIDWYRWGDEAFQKAKKENKLLVISIGYSASHWCHVMGKETRKPPGGAFYSAIYAVTARGEGAYYLWTWAEIIPTNGHRVAPFRTRQITCFRFP
jgi:uncharacterized protein YyaL (SSP411 family)